MKEVSVKPKNFFFAIKPIKYEADSLTETGCWLSSSLKALSMHSFKKEGCFIFMIKVM